MRYISPSLSAGLMLVRSRYGFYLRLSTGRYSCGAVLMSWMNDFPASQGHGKGAKHLNVHVIPMVHG
jgi:hypothetical protein